MCIHIIHVQTMTSSSILKLNFRHYYELIILLYIITIVYLLIFKSKKMRIHPRGSTVAVSFKPTIYYIEMNY